MEISRHSIDIYSIYNYYILSIMGIVFEIIGGLFLSMEAIGLKRFTNFYRVIHKVSQWSKSSFLRMLLLISPLFILLMVGVFYNSRIIIGLMIPLNLLILTLSALIDNPEWYEKWIIIKTKEGKISPIGFLVIVLGNILQLISIIWQMFMNN